MLILLFPIFSFALLSLNLDFFSSVLSNTVRLYSYTDPAFRVMYLADNFNFAFSTLLRMLSILSIVIMAISNIILFAIHKLTNYKIELVLRSKIFYSFIVITIIYVIPSIIILRDGDDSNDNFVKFFVFIYIISLVMALFYLLLNQISKKLKLYIEGKLVIPKISIVYVTASDFGDIPKN